MGALDLRRDMSMEELLAVYPGAQQALFQGFHIGGCSGCGFQASDTLEAVCRSHELDPEPVMEHLRHSHARDAAIELSPREVAARLQQGGVRLLDLRDEQDRGQASIPGALPVTETLAVEILTQWPKDTPIIVHCHHGHTSLDAASYLIGQGFSNVKSLAGGIDAWSRDVNPAVPRY